VDKNTVDSGKEHRDAEELKDMENVDLHHESSKTAREYTEMVHGPHGPDKSGMQKQMKSHGKQMAGRDLNLREQYDEKAIFQQGHGEQTPIAEPGCCDSPCIAIARSGKIDSQEFVIEVSPSSHPETVGTKSDSTSGASMPKDGSSSDPPRISPELEKGQPVEVQVKLDMKDGSSVNHVNPERCNHGPDQTQCDKDPGHESQDHIQSSQPQLPVSAKSSISELSKTEANTLHCEAPLKHEVANSQAHQFNNLQNTQQQWLSYTMPQNVQTSSQTQDQLVAQPNQGNQQYLQMAQGYASQMWQYYQQQMYYLQAQHNQQMQSLQQQQLPTEHLQQNFLQQVQQLNHQMVLWQQQQQQQLLQQALPVPQQPDNKQGQSSSGDTKHEQNKHHQQASQMDKQSQQLQQQQLLYFQQQQQQMYLMHQQQQAQQQQLLQQQLMQQQQYLLQRPQQQQDSVQQQQQLFQQQQQQMVLLQQQFIQQQMQQYAQQQQPQQGPKDQNHNSNTQVHSRLIHLTSLFFKGFCFSTPLCKKFMNITSTN
jgi:pre-mRNA-processing factor 39